MTKKIPIVYLMLLANIVLSAYTVLPHHHHHEIQICIETAHCNPASHNDYHSPADHDHGHHDNVDYDGDHCILKQLVAILSGENHKESSILGTDGSSYEIRAAIADQRLRPPTSIPKAHYDEHPLINDHNQYLVSSCGMRAPPFL